MLKSWRGGLALVVALLAAGCTGGEEEPATEGQAASMTAAMPDTTAESLWAHVEDGNYQEWPLWPGKGKLYTGAEPHGMLLTTYMNEVALEALTNHAGTMPAGAIVVKENYMPDSMLAAVTVMYKSEGFDPDHNDWYFLKRLTDGTVEVAGRGQGCQNCHGGVAANDYLFTGSLSQ